MPIVNHIRGFVEGAAASAFLAHAAPLWAALMFVAAAELGAYMARRLYDAAGLMAGL